jgi:hypothetical protein
MVGIRLELSGLGHVCTFVGVVRAQCVYMGGWPRGKLGKRPGFLLFQRRVKRYSGEDALWFRERPPKLVGSVLSPMLEANFIEHVTKYFRKHSPGGLPGAPIRASLLGC